jgi:hypothetical protein
MEVKEIKKQFKNSNVHNIIDMVLEDVNNFEFEKGHISGHSINVWRIEPVQDEGSFLYYENEAARDHDWDLLMGIIEAAAA